MIEVVAVVTAHIICFFIWLPLIRLVCICKQDRSQEAAAHTETDGTDGDRVNREEEERQQGRLTTTAGKEENGIAGVNAVVATISSAQLQRNHEVDNAFFGRIHLQAPPSISVVPLRMSPSEIPTSESVSNLFENSKNINSSSQDEQQQLPTASLGSPQTPGKRMATAEEVRQMHVAMLHMLVFLPYKRCVFIIRYRRSQNVANLPILQINVNKMQVYWTPTRRSRWV
jgi:hypothetical protein